MKRVLVSVPGCRAGLERLRDQTVYTGEPDASRVDAVYVGWHPDCGMKDIEAACEAIWNGAKLLRRLRCAILCN